MAGRLWKKVFLGVIAAVVLVSLSACAGKEEKKLSSDTVYRTEFREGELEGVGKCVMEDAVLSGRLYMSCLEWVEDDSTGWGNQSSFITCKTDGSDMKRLEPEGLGKNEIISAMAVDEKGKKRVVTQRGQKYFLYTLEDDGKLVDGMELKLEKQDSSFDISARKMAFSDGILYVGSGKKVYVFDETGKEKQAYEYQTVIEAVCRTSEGKLYIYANGGEANGDQLGFCELNPKTGQLGEFLPFQGKERISVMPGEGSVVYINDDNKLYSCDLSTGKTEEEFIWINQDVDGSSLSACFRSGKGFLAISGNYDEEAEKYQLELITVEKGTPGDGKEKQVLTLAMPSVDYDLKKEILSFNKQNKDIHIEMKDYSDYDDPEKQMNLDFAAGNIPDIINVVEGVSYEMLQKKGMFADLYPFMETDPEIKKEDFFPSVLGALEEEGKLYRLPPRFRPQFLVTTKEIADGREGWSADEMLEAYQGMKKGSFFTEFNTREEFLSIMLHGISLDSEEFVRLIEYSENFESEETFDYEKYYRRDWRVLVRKDKLFVSEEDSMMLMPDIQQYQNRYQEKGGFAVMAYPSEDRSGGLSMSLRGLGCFALAITEQCSDKEAAWQFVRRFLTYDFQKSADNIIYFPTRQDAFEKNLEYAMAQRSYIDEDGTVREPYHSNYFEGTESLEIGPISEEEADILREIVSRIRFCSDHDAAADEAYDIMEEELGAFYAGDKSAEETAEIIRNRVKIYLSENE